MRPTANRRRPKTRSSVRFCEEKYCCPYLESKAKFFCRDCKSAQCQDCEKSIHSQNLEYDFHIRDRLNDVPDSKLCQAKKISLTCANKNFPDLWCLNCCIPFCYSCYDTFHSSGKKKNHRNVSFAHYERKLREEKCNSKDSSLDLHDSLELYEDALSDYNNMIKPQTPFPLAEDDSLTYCSYPQESDEPDRNMAYTSNKKIVSPDSTPIAYQEKIGTLPPDVCVDAELPSALNKIAMTEDSICEANSFILVDDQEMLQVNDARDFMEKLGCDEKDTFKVVSIFGNTGDGKSFTLNNTFFNGHEVFQTSPSQTSCTVGVWCALDKRDKAVIIDTEGLLGSSSNENQRTRLLLKILAVSDVAIFRTRAERLHNDMFIFLSNASKAYCKHFASELKSASQKYGIPESSLGPTLIVFQETSHTDTIKDSKEKSAVGILREKFVESNNPVDAFRNICYVGLKTERPPTNFQLLQNTVIQQLKDTSVRSRRKPEIIYQSLKVLNDKFSEKIETPQLNTFPDQYFTCTSKCLACRVRCTLSMNHDTTAHDAGRDSLCQYQSQFGNKIFMCKHCRRNKEKSIVVPKTSSSSDSSWLGLTKYIWSGYVYECPKCGIIYRSREHWYGNEDEEKVLHVEFKHVWPQGPSSLDKTHNAARKALEGFSTIADTIKSVGSRPTKYLSEWTADQINPSYWIPNSEIKECSNCSLVFTCNEQKHHCRACGKGVCTTCSSKKRPVPERGWGPDPVRVCDKCNEGNSEENDPEPSQEPMTARKVGEAVSSTFSAVASFFEYPMDLIKDSARPEYWTPDDQITVCSVCNSEFGPHLAIHHCRACGQGVCEECSPYKCVVEFRGWDSPVRVCLKCEKKKDEFKLNDFARF